MAATLGILSFVVGLASFVFFIMVLIKLFQAKGALHGILGIISCGLYPLIWGWINADAQGIRTTMIRWTACIVLNIVLQIALIVFGGAAAMQQMQLPTQP